MTRSPATEKLARRIAERVRAYDIAGHCLGCDGGASFFEDVISDIEGGDFDDPLGDAVVSECAGCGEPNVLCENCRLDAARKARLEGNE